MHEFTLFNIISGTRTVLAAALTCLVVMAVSCRTIERIEYVTNTEYVHDTTEVYIHDTTTITSVVHDSVDRYIEKVTYVDKDGVVHEKEIERLTLVIRENLEEYHAKESEYKSKIAELETKLNESVKEVLVEKKLNWLQKTLIGFGVLFLVEAIGFIIYLALKLRKT